MIVSSIFALAVAGTPAAGTPIVPQQVPLPVTRTPRRTRLATAESRPNPLTRPQRTDTAIPYLMVGGGLSLVFFAGISFFMRRRNDGLVIPDIDVVASKTLGAKSKVVLLRAQGREVLVGVSEKGMELLADWNPENETPIAEQASVSAAPYRTPTPRAESPAPSDGIVFAEPGWLDSVEADFFQDLSKGFTEDEVTEEVSVGELSDYMKEALGDTLSSELAVALSAPEQKPSAESEAIRGLIELRRRRPMGSVA